MKYCSECGHSLTERIPHGDDRLRHVCDNCHIIHYKNPRIIAGCLPIYEDKVLLCKRAIEPRLGFWTLPAGFMENGESTWEAAVRETWEEATAKVEIESLYTLYNLPHINQVYIFFRGKLPKPEFAPGYESLETELFAEADIPWNEIAFPTVTKTLKLYFSDRPLGKFDVHTGDIKPPPKINA